MADITAVTNWRNKELVGMEEKVLKKLKMEVEERGLKLSIAEGVKEGTNKAITSCRYLEERFQECSRKEGVALETSVETLQGDLRTRTKQLGAKEKAGRKKCDVRFLLIRKNRELPEKIHEDWSKNAVEDRFGSRESVEEDKPWASRPQKG